MYWGIVVRRGLPGLEGVYIVTTELRERCLGEMSERIQLGRVRMKCAALASGICLSSTDKELLEDCAITRDENTKWWWELGEVRLGRLLRTSK